MAAITLDKPNAYVAILDGNDELLAIEPRLATEDDRDELHAVAHAACLTVLDVTATSRLAAATQVREQIATQRAEDIANESPDTPAEAALRARRMTSVPLDRI